MLTYPALIALYCFLVGAGFLGLWRFYDRRDHRSFERSKRKVTFHCIRCDRLYAAPEGNELCDCPACGHRNARLRF